ncbi:MAG: hypothetical protein RIT26_766 [Pseudomonadota bacterium]|jgi:uncharacterized protein (DUF1330 family)
MSKAYWITTYQAIHNPDALAAYAQLAGPSIAAAGGQFLVRGMPALVKEQGLMQRVVVIAFDSIAAAEAAYNSPGYQEALSKLTPGSVVRDMRFVEGV